MTEDGISLSEQATLMAMELRRQPENQGKPLRLYLDGKGCDGFFYGVCFDQQEPNDKVFSQGSIDIVVDSQTLMFCQGSLIEWVDDERGKGFLVKNPKHRHYRGKFYKRKAWQAKLTGQDDA